MNEPIRCAWVKSKHAQYVQYHDQEWGVPVRDDMRLFEFLILESAQAGLSWETILQKREGYRNAFVGFDVKEIAGYGEEQVEGLMLDKAIIRNRLKIRSAITNAQQFLKVQAEFGAFADYIWGFVQGQPIINRWSSIEAVPVTTDISDRISKDLKKRGFKFVGSTTMYAFMQAVGMVNDHTTDCFRHAQLCKNAHRN